MASTYALVFSRFCFDDEQACIRHLAKASGLSIKEARDLCLPGSVVLETEDSGAAVGLMEELRTFGVVTSLTTLELEDVEEPEEPTGIWNNGHAAQSFISASSAGQAGPPKRYAEIECDDCGLILPKNETFEIAVEEQSGRQSGTVRRSYGVSQRNSSSHSGSGFRTGYSSGSSSRRTTTPGREFYRTVHLRLCTDCLEGRERAERQREATESSLEFQLMKGLNYLFGRR